MNYEVAIKPYLKGAENTTVVAIKMEEKGRYSYEQVELHGDHTQDINSLKLKPNRRLQTKRLNIIKKKPTVMGRLSMRSF